MTSSGNSFNDFPEIVPTSEITAKINMTFLVFSSVALGLFLEWAAASIAPTLIRRCVDAVLPSPLGGLSDPPGGNTELRACVQVGCALVSHALSSVVWQQSMLAAVPRHSATVVTALHCGHPDGELDAAVTALAQFVGVLLLAVFTLRCGSVVVDLFEIVGQLLVSALMVAGGTQPTPTPDSRGVYPPP